MSNHWKKLAAAAFLAFVVLWACGFLRTFTLAERDVEPLLLPSLPSASARDEYSSGNKTASNVKQVAPATPLPQVLDGENVSKVQVYEKTAQLTSATTQFTDDEEHVRTAIATHKAVVFNEKDTGIAPNRLLTLAIGVHPDQFDSLVQQLSKVGTLGSIAIQQQDRTGEFRRLHAQRQSLKTHLEAILKLRGKNNLSVEEALKLEQKVLEVEKEVQSINVQLGDLLGNEPTYNLFLTLHEVRPGSLRDRHVTVAERIGYGLVWAIGWWLTAALGIGVLGGTVVSVRTLRYRG